MTPLPWFAGTLLFGLAYRYLTRRRGGKRIRLPDGRSLELLSAVTLRSGPAWHLLALEYVSALPAAAPDGLHEEARSVLYTAAGWPEFAQCREATITVHLGGVDRTAVAGRKHVFGFHRHDTGAAWEPAPMSG